MRRSHGTADKTEEETDWGDRRVIKEDADEEAASNEGTGEEYAGRGWWGGEEEIGSQDS